MAEVGAAMRACGLNRRARLTDRQNFFARIEEFRTVDKRSRIGSC
jgi:hypothetical protein